jgi:hypothetical protein
MFAVRTTSRYPRIRGILLVTLYGVLATLSACSVYNDLVLDNRNDSVSCDEFPTRSEVERVMDAQQPVVEQILSVNPGQVFVDLDDVTCPGKIGLMISYPTHEDRIAIEHIPIVSI